VLEVSVRVLDKDYLSLVGFNSKAGVVEQVPGGLTQRSGDLMEVGCVGREGAIVNAG
jgi:hypothetical protein